MKTLYRIILFSGLAPLTIGLLIFFSWLMTRSSWLMAAGIINLLSGLCLFIVGLVCFGVYLHKVKSVPLHVPLWYRILPILILLTNFPVAATIMYVVNDIETTSVITIVNNSEYPVTEFYLQERDKKHEVGSVLPGEVKKESFHFRQEGTVMYFFRLKENDYNDIMFGYVTNGMAKTGSLTISRSRTITVEQKL